MKKYIVLVIAALCAVNQPIAASLWNSAYSDAENQKLEALWQESCFLGEVVKDFEEEVECLKVSGASWLEVNALEKAAQAVAVNRLESRIEMINFHDTIIRRLEPMAKLTPGEFVLAGVGLSIGCGLLSIGLAAAYNDYYDEDPTPKKTTMLDSLGLAAFGAIMVGLLAPVVYNACTA